MGELEGGYSAYEANGSVLGGVAGWRSQYGAASGELDYTVSTTRFSTFDIASDQTFSQYVSANAMRVVEHSLVGGAIRGAGLGAVSAYAGGAGNFGGVVRGALKGAVMGVASRAIQIG